LNNFVSFPGDIEYREKFFSKNFRNLAGVMLIRKGGYVYEERRGNGTTR
jgi:hypothetical protein